MHRVLGVTLTGLGAFLVVLAILSRFYLPGQVIKFPLNEYTISTLTGTHVSYLNEQSGSNATASTVRATSTTQGDVSAGDSSTAVWNEVVGVFDTSTSSAPGTPITYSSERLAFNRRTGELVNCCGTEIGTKHVHVSGLGYVWPIGAQKKNYQVFDTTLLKPVPTVYSGTATVDGRTTYVYVEHVNHRQFSSITVPGNLAGIINQSTVTLPEYLTETITDYVDPGVGSPVKVVEQEDLTLVNPSTGATALTLYNGTLTSTPATIASAIHTAEGYDTEITWLQNIAPIIGFILGIVLLILGMVLVLGTRREESFEYEEEEEEGIPSEA
jgi:hypothetical protein